MNHKKKYPYLLDLYIVKKFLGTFFVVLSLLLLIVVVIDLAENIQDFLDGNAPFKEIFFNYYLNFIPYFANTFSPLFTFVAVIYFTSRLSVNTEIVAILNAGVSFYRLMVPYIFSAICIGLLSLYLTNSLIPQTSKNMMLFKEKYVSRQIRSKEVDNHIKLDKNTYAYIHYWDNKNNMGFNFWYETLSPNGISYKLRSQVIQWDSTNQQWQLGTYLIRWFDGKEERLLEGETLDTSLNVQISDFIYIKDGIALMNSKELRQFINEEIAKGSPMVKSYEFEKHRRIAFPFATIILTIIGFCISSRKSRQGTGLHLLMGFVIAFSFIMLLQISQMFAIYGGFSPFWAAWTPNILYTFLSGALIYISPK